MNNSKMQTHFLTKSTIQTSGEQWQYAQMERVWLP